MKIFVHFLGYSSSEGGIQEIFTDEVFSMGSINLETGEREFDEFEFKIPMSSILKTKPSVNNNWILGKSISYSETGTYNKVNLIGTALEAGDQIWIENERIQIFYNPANPNLYDITRGVNSSIPIYHQSEIINEQYGQCITATLNRISPIGLIVKIYTSENEILSYGQIKNLKMNQSGYVTIECDNLYSQIETPLIFNSDRPSHIYNNGDVSFTVFRSNRINEFFALLQSPSLPYEYRIKYEEIGITSSNNKVFYTDKIKDYIQQILNINSSYISFENGLYIVRDFGRPVIENSHTNILLSRDLIRNGGSIDVELAPPFSCVTLNNELLTKPIIKWNNDSNFTNYYSGSKKATIELSAVYIDNPDSDILDTLMNIASYKLFTLNSIIEYLTIDANKYTKPFKVGLYYKILDIYKYPMFYDEISDNVYFCIGVDESTIKLVRTGFNQTLLVAPSLLVTKTDTSEYTLSPVGELGDYIYMTNYSIVSELVNEYTNELMWEIDDNITIIDVNNNITFGVVVDLTHNTFTLNVDPGSIGDYFYITIERWNSGNIADKNKVYFYDNNLGVL